MPEETSVRVTVCPAGVWLYEPGTGQKVGVAAAGGGGGGGGGGGEAAPPPPQPVVTSARNRTENKVWAVDW